MLAKTFLNDLVPKSIRTSIYERAILLGILAAALCCWTARPTIAGETGALPAAPVKINAGLITTGNIGMQDGITPFVDCVSYDTSNGDLFVRWGYINPFPSTQFVDVGSDNMINPPPPNRGQSVFFDPGVNHSAWATTIQLNPSVTSITWTVLGKSATATNDPTLYCLGFAGEGNTSTGILNTGFTYQGRLTDGGKVANGAYDLQFALYDSLSGGSLKAGVITIPGVTVTGGVFTVQLDFGDVVVPGYYLEIGAEHTGDSSFTILSPRQRITASPFATHSAIADSVLSISGQSPDNVSLATTRVLTGTFPSIDTGDAVVSGNLTVTGILNATLPAGSGNYVQNTTTQQANSNFNISGNGTIGGSLTVTGALNAALPAGSGNYVQNTTTQQAGSNFNVSGNGTVGGNLTVTGTLNATLPSGSANYIQNTTTQQAISNFNISGNGTAGGSLTGNVVSATTQYNVGSSRVIGVDNRNTYVGLGAGGATTTGSLNTFVGNNAGLATTSGGNNSFLGFQSGVSNTSGSNNTFLGLNSGFGNTTGSNNVFIGPNSAWNGTAGNTIGANNTFIGGGSGTSNTTENNNTFIGAGSNGFAGITNSTAIGANSQVTVSNGLVLGNSNNNVGIGTTAPNFKLHIADSGFPSIRLDGSNPTGAWLELNNTSTGGHNWGILSSGAGNSEGAGNLVITDVTGGGHIVMNAPLQVPSCTGCTVATSDRNAKSNITAVNSRIVLEKLVGIPIQTWNYNDDKAGLRHIGPMAQDFFAAFGLGSDDKHINLIDEGGVALAAIQELYKNNISKDQQINDLKKQVNDLKAAGAEVKNELDSVKASNAELMKRLEALEKAEQKKSGRQQ